MSFFRKISPTGAVKDFAQVWTSNPYRWRVLALSMAATGGMMAVFIPKSEIVPPAKPEVTYITTFREGRTDAEIVASNIRNQKIQDEVRKLDAEREEYQKELYRQIGRATLIDTDAIEKQIAREKAAEAKVEAAKAEAAKAKAAAAEARTVAGQ